MPSRQRVVSKRMGCTFKRDGEIGPVGVGSGYGQRAQSLRPDPDETCTVRSMPHASTLAVFAGAALALLVIPGPAVIYIVTRSVDQGRAAGVASVLGIHCGTLVHIAA